MGGGFKRGGGDSEDTYYYNMVVGSRIGALLLEKVSF